MIGSNFFIAFSFCVKALTKSPTNETINPIPVALSAKPNLLVEEVIVSKPLPN